MIDTIRLVGRVAPSRLDKSYFLKTATMPESYIFEDMGDLPWKKFGQDKITGTFRVAHDGREPQNTYRVVKTKEGQRKVPCIEGGETCVEFSVSKVLWSTNMYEMGMPGLAVIQSCLSGILGGLFYGVGLEEFHVTRLDVGFNLSPEKIKSDAKLSSVILQSLARMDFDRRRGMNYTSSHDKKTQTVLWETRNQKSKFMFYDKKDEVERGLRELKKHQEGSAVVRKAVDMVLAVMDGIPGGLIRIERKVAEKGDLSRYGIENLADINVDVVRRMLMDSIDRLEVPEAEYSQPEEIWEALEQKVQEGEMTLEDVAKWHFIFQLRRRVSESDKDFIERYGGRLGFSERTYYNYKKLFKEVGINVRNLGEQNLQGIRDELGRRCEVWEKSTVSLNGELREVQPFSAEEILESCRVKGRRSK